MSDATVDKKIGLDQMIFFVEAEIGDADSWERVLGAEGKKLYESMAERRRICTALAKLLWTIKLNEQQFIETFKRVKVRA